MESTQRGHDITIRDFNYIKVHTYVRGCVRADAYNLILIFASYYYAPWTWPWPWPCTVYIYMTRERHVILKAVLHSRLTV